MPLGTVAVTFFGEGAMNQGMMMETLNLAVAWLLPVQSVCNKDNQWVSQAPRMRKCPHA
jgi:acetoin:2,6-dichlorophenolindophenol oxidoreductase subunit alpha